MDRAPARRADGRLGDLIVSRETPHTIPPCRDDPCGSKLFMDSSLVKADASNDSVVNRESLGRYLKLIFLVWLVSFDR